MIKTLIITLRLWDTPIGWIWRDWAWRRALRQARQRRLDAVYFAPLNLRADYAKEAFIGRQLLDFWGSGDWSAIENVRQVERDYRRVKEFINFNDGLKLMLYTKGIRYGGPPLVAACVFVLQFIFFGLNATMIGVSAGVFFVAVFGCWWGGNQWALYYKWSIGHMPLHIIERAQQLEDGEWTEPWDTYADEARFEEQVNGDWDPTIITGIVETTVHRLLKIDDELAGEFYPGPQGSGSGIMGAIMRMQLPLGMTIPEFLKNPATIYLLTPARHTLVPTSPAVTYNWIQEEVTIGEEERREEIEQEGGPRWQDILRKNYGIIIMLIMTFLVILFTGDDGGIDDLMPLLESYAEAEGTPTP